MLGCYSDRGRETKRDTDTDIDTDRAEPYPKQKEWRKNIERHRDK